MTLNIWTDIWESICNLCKSGFLNIILNFGESISCSKLAENGNICDRRVVLFRATIWYSYGRYLVVSENCGGEF